MSYNLLFSKHTLGAIELNNRMIMAPLTRSRAQQPGDIPNELNAEYYQQRASAGMIITEATYITPQGKGYAFTPGIYSPEQIDGWKKVTDAIHQKNGLTFMQLWHVGRVSHSSLQPNNQLPVAPSAIAVTDSQAFTETGMLDFETPRALETDEIAGIIADYRQAAINAKQAGFDGVEIHAANGYLLDQFLKDGTNKRTDKYGGSIENRISIVLEVTEAVTEVWGSDRVGIRLSPNGTFNSMSETKPQELYNHLVEALNQFNLAYIHIVERFGVAKEDDKNNHFDYGKLRQLFNGSYIANGGYTGETAEQSLVNNESDFVAFGVPFIANPDLPARIQQGLPLNQPDQATFYGGGEKGYTDYPSLT